MAPPRQRVPEGPPPEPVVIRVRLGKRFEPQADHRSVLRAVERYFAQEIGG